MSDLTKQQSLPRTSVTETVRMPLRLTAIVAGLLLMMMPFLTGCGGDGGDSAPPAGATASLAWSPVPDPSGSGYFVHYGQQSPGQPGSCAYESSMNVDSPSATITKLEYSTLYYFTVSAYYGVESACSNEVSTVTPPASVEADRPGPSHDPRNAEHDPRNAKHDPRHRARLDSAPDDVTEHCYGRSSCTDPFNS